MSIMGFIVIPLGLLMGGVTMAGHTSARVCESAFLPSHFEGAAGTTTDSLTRADIRSWGIQLAENESFQVSILNPLSSVRNGGIYRVVIRGAVSRSLVSKNYGDNAWRAPQEIEKMTLLSKWLSETPPPLEGAFKVATYTPSPNPERVFVQDILGQTVNSVLSSSVISKSVRVKVRALYDARLAHYVKALMGRGPFYDIWFQPSNLVEAEGFGDLSVEKSARSSVVLMKPATKDYFDSREFMDERGLFLLKPNQVIVDPTTLEMTIIDPF